MRNWEPQPLPGILEDLPPLSVLLPSEALETIRETLERLEQVTIRDWLDSEPTQAELYCVAVALDNFTMLVDFCRARLIRKALIQ